ncbi:unnamed protein product [Rhizophagus irregularis]|nr:unnamed protein product [Rhizophagus irregularis]
MSSSKIFSEDLLLWCRLAIPLLWENPFSIPTGNFNFIEVYLYNLDDNLKAKLNEYTDYVLLPSNTLFNYPSFIRYLNINKIVPSIEKWLEANNRTSKIRVGNYQDFGIELLLQNLVQALPSKLEYLSLDLCIRAIDFKVFLKNSQDTFFKKLVISNIRWEGGNYIDYIDILLM